MLRRTLYISILLVNFERYNLDVASFERCRIANAQLCAWAFRTYSKTVLVYHEVEFTYGLSSLVAKLKL